MSREIKFRAWDKGIMLYNITVKNSYAFLDGQHLTVENGDIKYSLMQFTGLFDKKGMEIWEGDVVKASGSGIGEIFYCYLDAMFKCKWHDKVYKTIRGGKGEQIFRNHEITLAVIGNIHENPELITQ